MKKIVIFIFMIFIIPFIIVNISEDKRVHEIDINYVDNLFVRVKRMDSGNIDKVTLEEYVLGVLAGEMPISFESEALKAQAVASRSYVLKRMEYNKDSDYDVVDSVMNQVYLDRDYLKEAWGDDYTKNINKLIDCVNDTMGEYLSYEDSIVDALFFSTSNGYTEDSDVVFSFALPYLKSVDSSWDKNVSTAFSSTVTYNIYSFYELLETSYDENFVVSDIVRSKTGRVISLSINGKSFTGNYLYNKLGLKSLDFSLEKNLDNIIIYTTGYGHGVGMSQYGAEGMALEGYSYKDILLHYYTDVSIKKI